MIDSCLKKINCGKIVCKKFSQKPTVLTATKLITAIIATLQYGRK